MLVNSFTLRHVAQHNFCDCTVVVWDNNIFALPDLQDLRDRGEIWIQQNNCKDIHSRPSQIDWFDGCIYSDVDPAIVVGR